MKLTLILEDSEGQKVERVVKLNEPNGGYLDGFVEVIKSMVESLQESKKPI